METTSTPPNWEYRMFWYVAYVYFQNACFFNSLFGNCKKILSELEDFFYRKNWEQIEIKYPIFIVGPHRSGTTIFQQLLCLHSMIATPKTYSDIFDMFPILSKRFARFLIPRKVGRRIDDVIAGPESPQEAQGLIFRYFDKQKVIYNQATSNDIVNYMRKLLYIERKSRFLWKAPYLSIRVPEVNVLFPDAKFIYLHRDPLSCVDSKIKFIRVWQEIAKHPTPLYRALVGKHDHFEIAESGYFWERLNRTINLQYLPPDPHELTKDHLDWVERALRNLNTLASSKKTCFLSYSKLILEPKTSLERVFEFLDLPDESDSIIANLEKLGMALKVPESELRFIPSDAMTEIMELCQEKLKNYLSRVEWEKWCVI